MSNLTNLEIGSVVYNLVENIPSAVSGTLSQLVNQNCYYAELITGNDVDPTAITEPYQPGIISLTIGNVLGVMGAQGMGTNSVKIGELAISKGMNTQSAQEWKQLGMNQIKSIGEKISYYQTWT